ncbi:SET domain containing protein [Trichomonas vaginalis G3]|uniref:[histone H3]-lysine(4) N-trimethyltransferase n=1 Tax=Trichomonas vaginalis (strain ATCC PRA-98 / G3) TaxID=412133 RepID=A2D8M2_TRIV3|nr:histone-lysine N-methyltransferase protein [Trichomonas vaginalis G3]EAY23271.1 SET domain containing protein [Trichomonas vaginalis G3]KAI5534080.1 histone-lysine N-methyltransferase protein [Trichomonas vaginalis G3]|eukprot:XP_001584257.1 SET domain containing protein [Trichomonas vaginalis G3]
MENTSNPPPSAEVVDKNAGLKESLTKCGRFTEIKTENPDIRRKFFTRHMKSVFQKDLTYKRFPTDREFPSFICSGRDLDDKIVVHPKDFQSIRSQLKYLRFEKSGIHLWGVFSACYFAPGEPIVEYTGELVRLSVTEARQKYYETEGNHGSYIFRLDDDLYIDATHKGGIARFLNHSCDPNCKTCVVEAGGQRHIVIFAKKKIEPFEELTYDYNLPYESKEKAIVCLCGSPKCRGYLNYTDKKDIENEPDDIPYPVNES